MLRERYILRSPSGMQMLVSGVMSAAMRTMQDIYRKYECRPPGSGVVPRSVRVSTMLAEDHLEAQLATALIVSNMRDLHSNAVVVASAGERVRPCRMPGHSIDGTWRMGFQLGDLLACLSPPDNDVRICHARSAISANVYPQVSTNLRSQTRHMTGRHLQNTT